MSDCPLIAGCIFFNDKMADMPSIAGIYKQQYCHTDHLTCARYAVCEALGRENVPADLFPNQMDRARDLLEKGSVA